jgi:hypothetical protein
MTTIRPPLEDLEAEALMLYSPEWGYPRAPGFGPWLDDLVRRRMLERVEPGGKGRITRYGMECLVRWFENRPPMPE